MKKGCYLLLILLILIIYISCSATRQTLVNEFALSSKVNSWTIQFTYENEVIEKKEVSKTKTEITRINMGQPGISIQLLDDIYYMLKYNHLISIEKVPNSGSGIIKIHPVININGYLGSVDITIYDTANILIARSKLSSPISSYSSNDMAAECVKYIIEIIKKD